VVTSRGWWWPLRTTRRRPSLSRWSANSAVRAPTSARSPGKVRPSRAPRAPSPDPQVLSIARCPRFLEVLLDRTAVSRCHPGVPCGFDRMIGVLMRSYGARTAGQCA
jgi:hypothetical protein